MDTIVFDGVAEAAGYEQILKERVSVMSRRPRILSVVFDEDAGSQLYTRLKFEAAARVGIEFDRQDFLMNDPVDQVREQIRLASEREDVAGVMIQKPAKSKWNQVMQTKGRGEFQQWWLQLTNQIQPSKDVDCLTQENLSRVYSGSWQLLPATVRGVLMILEIALEKQVGSLSINEQVEGVLSGVKVAVLGRSEIVGRPLAAVLAQAGAEVDICGSQTEDLGLHTAAADVVISATGKKHLIKEDLVKHGAVVIDVGSPNPDVDYEHVVKTAGFITPVPYGVGPMTVVSLLMNLLEMVG